MFIPPDTNAALADLRPGAHRRGGGKHDCPTCGARASVKRGRCMTCGAGMSNEPGLLRRAVRRLFRRSA